MRSHCDAVMPRRIVVFESMSRLDIVWAYFLALTGKTVLYIKKPRRVARSLLVMVLRLRFFRRRIRRYRIEWKKDYYDGMWGDKAFDVIEDVYLSLAKLGFVQGLLAQFNYAGELAIKKELNTHLSRFFYLNELLGIIGRSFNSRITFVPAYKIKYDYYVTGFHEAMYYGFLKKLVCAGGVLLNDHKKVYFSFVVQVLGAIEVCAEILMRHARMAGLIVKTFFTALKNSFLKPPTQKWRYAAMIMSIDRQFQNDVEGLDFFINGRDIKKEDVVFIPHSFVRLGKREIGIIERKKLNYVRSLYAYFSFEAWVRMIRSCPLVLRAHKPIFVKVGYALCIETAVWESFSLHVYLENVIGNHDVSVSALCRNLILEKRQGTRSWLYLDSNNFSNFFLPEDGKIRYKINFYSFMIYDYVVCWNDKMEQIISSMHNKVKEYYQSGCLWSTFIKRRMAAVHRAKNSGMRTIAVFDSSYHNYSVSSPRCAYFFYNGILRMLNEMKNIRVLMKPKKSRKQQKLFYEDRPTFCAIDELVRHPRCVAMDYTQPRGEIIAKADLVVAYPFTSPAFEAVCAGVPAIYFDATGSFPESRYEGCGMVASGYEELVEKVKTFLAMPRSDFYKWREDNQSFFDGFLDGQGLDRFVERLSKKAYR